jgi:hypothetical protein
MRGRCAHLNNGGSAGRLHTIATRRESTHVAPGIEIDGRRHMPLLFSCSVQLAPALSVLRGGNLLCLLPRCRLPAWAANFWGELVRGTEVFGIRLIWKLTRFSQITMQCTVH